MAKKNKKLKTENKMAKKILLGLAAVLVVAGGVAALSAYEAHIINVTAKIENALSVTPDSLPFGTVFPNEHLTKPLIVELSGSFLTEPRVDDVSYVIKQKAKPTASGNTEDCEVEVSTLYDCVTYEMSSGGIGYEEAITSCYDQYGYNEENCYLPLCTFLSKEEDGTPTPSNDIGLGAPHDPGDMAYGKLAKSAQDTVDNWIIDLQVPCFIGNCAQGETGYLPPQWEHGSFGCDLWIEVTGISPI